MPLDGERVDRSLAPPTREELRRRIAASGNPLIRSRDVDPAAAITPEDAGVIAALCSPTVRAQRSRIDVAASQLLQATLLPNPTVSFNLDVPVGRNTAGEATGYGLGIGWEISALIARSARIDAARAAGEQVRLDVAWSEWQAAQAARQAAYDVAALRAQRDDARQLDAQLQRIASRAQRSLAAGDLTAADASAALAAAQESAVALATNARDLRDAELSLNQAIGFAPDCGVRVAEHVELPTTLPAVDGLAISRGLENRRFDLVALRRGYASQEAGVRAAILGQFPRVALGLSNTRDFGDFLTLGPTGSIDLPIFDRNQGNIAIAKATRQQLADEYVARVFEARADVARAAELIRSLGATIAVQVVQVDALRALLNADEQTLARGDLDVPTFYAVAVNLSQKQSELTKSKQEWVHAWIALELAAGARLDDSNATTRPEMRR